MSTSAVPAVSPQTVCNVVSNQAENKTPALWSRGPAIAAYLTLPVSYFSGTKITRRKKIRPMLTSYANSMLSVDTHHND